MVSVPAIRLSNRMEKRGLFTRILETAGQVLNTREPYAMGYVVWRFITIVSIHRFRRAISRRIHPVIENDPSDRESKEGQENQVTEAYIFLRIFLKAVPWRFFYNSDPYHRHLPDKCFPFPLRKPLPSHASNHYEVESNPTETIAVTIPNNFKKLMPFTRQKAINGNV